MADQERDIDPGSARVASGTVAGELGNVRLVNVIVVEAPRSTPDQTVSRSGRLRGFRNQGFWRPSGYGRREPSFNYALAVSHVSIQQ